MTSELKEAVWQGPFDALLPTGQVVHPGETALVTDGDLRSAHWKAVRKPAAPRQPAAAPTPEVTD